MTVLSGGSSFRWPNVGEIVVLNYDILPDFLDPTPKAKGAPARLPRRMDWTAVEGMAGNPQGAASGGGRRHAVVFDEDPQGQELQRRSGAEGSGLARAGAARSGAWPSTPFEQQAIERLVRGCSGQSRRMAFDSVHPSEGAEPAQTVQRPSSTPRRPASEWNTANPIRWFPNCSAGSCSGAAARRSLPNLPTKTYTNLVVGEMPASVKKELDQLWDEDGIGMELDGRLPAFSQMSEVRAKLAKHNIPAMLEYVEECEEQECAAGGVFLAPLPHRCSPGAVRARAVITGDTSPQKRQEIVDAFQARSPSSASASLIRSRCGVGLHADPCLERCCSSIKIGCQGGTPRPKTVFVESASRATRSKSSAW